MTNKAWAILLSVGAIVIVGLWMAANYFSGQSQAPAANVPAPAATPGDRQTAAVTPTAAVAVQLSSLAWQNGASIPERYTCDGEDVSPPLAIMGVPDSAESLVLIVDDPDAPRGDWVHWTAWNIPPGTAEIAEGSAPAGAVEGTTDFGKPGYGGPCPPSGEHRYQFKLYAIDTTLDLSPSARKGDIEQAMQGHILEQATLAGRYRRS